jgi:hypothetical protein
VTRGLRGVRHAGSQLPLMMPRSDARQNLIDSMTCATAFYTPPHTALQEVAICFGGRLMRGNRTQKVRSEGIQPPSCCSWSIAFLWGPASGPQLSSSAAALAETACAVPPLSRMTCNSSAQSLRFMGRSCSMRGVGS